MRTSSLPGTTKARTPEATWCPRITWAAARRSSIRELVQLPKNTVFTVSSSMLCPGRTPMYIWARFSEASLGSGIAPVTSTVMAGVVPQVTCGTRAEASISISRSNVAPSSVASCRHSAIMRSRSAPLGANGRSSAAMNSNVVSSGAIIPARAPISMLMLAIVMRPCIESDRTASPRYSTTWPVPPPAPRVRMM